MGRGGFLGEVGTELHGFGDTEKIRGRTWSQEDSVRKAREQNRNHFWGAVLRGCVTCREKWKVPSLPSLTPH